MTSALHSPVCDLLGCEVPIVLAGMGGVARSELVAAVIAAGGFGFLGMVREPVSLIRNEIQRLRERGIERFGVNLIPSATDPALLESQVATCLELAVPVVCLFWDIPTALVQTLRHAGIVVVCQVGSVAEAQDAANAGAHALIVQGIEAGGHIRGHELLETLVPAIEAGVSLPVLAAGGITDGADVARMWSLGAQGVVLGTALIATYEAFAHDFHKQRIVEAGTNATVITDYFHINWPRGARVRVLANSVTRDECGDPFSSGRVVIGEEEGRPIYLFSTDSPLRSMSGDFEAMALYAGTGVAGVTEIISAKERVHRIVAEASRLLRRSGHAHRT